MNREAVRAYQAKYRAQHRDKLNADALARYYANREARLEYLKNRYQGRKLEAAIEGKLRYQKNRVAILEKQKVYGKAHSVAITARAVAYARKFPDRVKAYKKKWRDTHQFERAMADKARRAKQAGIDLSEHQRTLAEQFYASLRAKPFVRCYWCGARISDSDIHVDHVIALAKGGNHAVENLAASCRPCNQSKCAKLPHEWTKHPQMFFTL